MQHLAARPPHPAARGIRWIGVSVLDAVYVLGIVAVFALIGLIARGIEKL